MLTEYLSDQSPRSVVHRIQLQLGEDAAFLLQGRVRIIKWDYSRDSLIQYKDYDPQLIIPFLSAWRPLQNAVHEWPLALCDSVSMPQQDLVECDHVRKRFKGTAYYSYYNPDHKWYYLGEQKPDEVTFLKIFDSDSKGGAKSIFSHLFSSYYTYDY